MKKILDGILLMMFTVGLLCFIFFTPALIYKERKPVSIVVQPDFWALNLFNDTVSFRAKGYERNFMYHGNPKAEELYKLLREAEKGNITASITYTKGENSNVIMSVEDVMRNTIVWKSN